jgi:hypothetical protein
MQGVLGGLVVVGRVQLPIFLALLLGLSVDLHGSFDSRGHGVGVQDYEVAGVGLLEC